MENLIYIFVIVGIVILLVFYQRWTSKKNLIGGNSFMQSDATTEAIDQMSKDEEALQEARLMQNNRYRILQGFLMDEVKNIQSMSANQVKEMLKHGQSERIATHSEFNVVIRLYMDLKSSSTTAVKVTVHPKRFLGTLFSVEKWVYLK